MILSPTIPSNIPFNLANLDDGKAISAEINTIFGVMAVHSDTTRILNTHIFVINLCDKVVYIIKYI